MWSDDTKRRLAAFARSTSGASAVEFALWLTAIAYPLASAVDFGFYLYQRMQVENAAQMAAVSAYGACTQAYAKPIFTNCSATGVTAVTAGAQSTSLGSSVTVADTTEYLDGARKTGTKTGPPSASGDYLGVTVNYTYTPILPRAAITSILGTTIARTYWIRMG